MKKAMMLTLMIIAAVIVLALVAAYTLQEKMIFFPDHTEAGCRYSFTGNWKELYFQVDKKVRIHAIYFQSQQHKALVIYHHGNAGSLASWGGVAEDFTALGYDLLIYDFRGYGKSEGKIRNEQMLLDDALYIYDHRPGHFPDTAVIQYGRSIGTGIAAWSAAHRPAAKLILETPYYDFPSVARDHMPLVPPFIISYKLRTSEWLSDVSCPIYLFHGTDDAIIPYKHSVKIVSEHPGALLFTIPGGHHNDLGQSEQYHKNLKAILIDGLHE